MYNSKIWKHYKILHIEMFPKEVEFNATFVLFVIMKSRINVYVENVGGS